MNSNLKTLILVIFILAVVIAIITFNFHDIYKTFVSSNTSEVVGFLKPTNPSGIIA